MTKDISNPVETLSLPQRLAAGPVVSKLYKAKQPKFMRRVESMGAHGAALLTCLQVLAGYAVGFTAAGWVSLATPDAALSSLLFPVSAIFGFWALSVMFALNRVAPFIGGFGDSDKTGTA